MKNLFTENHLFGYKKLSSSEIGNATSHGKHIGLSNDFFNVLNESNSYRLNLNHSLLLFKSSSYDASCMIIPINPESIDRRSPRIKDSPSDNKSLIDHIREKVNSSQDYYLVWDVTESSGRFILIEKDSEDFKLIEELESSDIDAAKVELIKSCFDDANTSSEIEEKYLTKFTINVLKFLLSAYKEDFLSKNGLIQDIGISDKRMTIPKYFGSATIFGIFYSQESLDQYLAGDRQFKFHDDNLKILGEQFIFFSNQCTSKRTERGSHIVFEDFRKFVEDYSNNDYTTEIVKNGNYQLILKTEKPEREFLFSVKRSLREFAFRTFRSVHDDFRDEFLDLKRSNFERTHNKHDIKAIGFQDYFGTKKIFAVFDSEQTKESLKTGTSLRYNPINLAIMGEEYIYFSSQWSHPYDKSHPCFDEFVKFINDYGQGSYEIEYDSKEKIYSLFKFSDKQNTKGMKPIQKIFFGPPGTGKSYHIRKEYGEDLPRVTFHPELDYQGFIGTYKPTVISTPTGDQITYKFIEEAFLRAYCKAWDSVEPYYLIIEEINRGNCAQIFGDIFQLLDRNDKGFSEYPIICSPDVQRHLAGELAGISRLQEYKEETKSDDFSRMTLPNNLNILCTMNTSDQSLFPMDSAFKRRWDWQYIPIDYEDAKRFEIDLEDGKNTINWGAFINKINESIKGHMESEDKQLGNRFVSSANYVIAKDEFVSKVVFYLWSEIYKDEQGSGNSIFYTDSDTEITFGDFFKGKNVDDTITRKFIEYNLRDIKNENGESQPDSIENEEDPINRDD